jgi:hypothetical protein
LTGDKKMKTIEAKYGKTYKPEYADEWLVLLRDIAYDYDGLDTSVQSMRELVDELVEYATNALNCIRENKITEAIWTNIKNQLPKDKGTYLVTMVDSNTQYKTSSSYWNGQGFTKCGGYIEVTHWALMPEPAKEREQNAR